MGLSPWENYSWAELTKRYNIVNFSGDEKLAHYPMQVSWWMMNFLRPETFAWKITENLDELGSFDSNKRVKHIK